MAVIESPILPESGWRRALGPVALIASQVLALPAMAQDGAPAAEPPPAVEAAELAGSWQARWTQTEGTCPVVPGEVSAYQWIVSAAPNGTVTVNVLGQTSFPTMSGVWKPSESTLTLTGTYTDDQTVLFSDVRRHAVWIQLKLIDGGQLVGVRRYLGLHELFPCFIDGEMVVTR